ncbi:MAG TPA: glutathione S-transferase family protein [Capillimicrobium sp.]|nr:glutathione S-transferase family protein [Capillimicrobium sp.]
MTAVLWHIPLSHYSEKARWALDYKGVEHTRRAPPAGLHQPWALALTRGRHRRLPILDLDGRRVADSTAIIAALEAAHPEPPLYPTDPRERERALALEEFFDEHLAPPMRAWTWHHTLPDPDLIIAGVMPNASEGRKRVARATAPIVRPLMRADYDIGADKAADQLAQIRAAMDRIEAELQPSGYLVGDAFGVADLTAAALFTPLIAPPQRPYVPATVAPRVLEVREELEARPGGQWVLEMYARHRGR